MLIQHIAGYEDAFARLVLIFSMIPLINLYDRYGPNYDLRSM